MLHGERNPMLDFSMQRAAHIVCASANISKYRNNENITFVTWRMKLNAYLWEMVVAILSLFCVWGRGDSEWTRYNIFAD